MFPVLRLLYYKQLAKRKPKFKHLFEPSSIHMRVLPSDLDLFLELNNGRYLTLMDIGRFDVVERMGAFSILKEKKWGLTVGAVNIRYRHRLRLFEPFTLHSQIVFVDERWFYFHQRVVNKKNKVTTSCLVRTAVTSKEGLIPTIDVLKALNFDTKNSTKNEVIQDWIKKWEASDHIHKDIMEPPNSKSYT